MSFIPTFKKYQELYGFDDSVTPFWQMVPLNGEKFVYLENAENMTVQVLNPKIAKVSEVSDNSKTTPKQQRLFKIEGLSHGETYLDVTNNNISKTKLEICVKKSKTVSLAFNFVSDVKNRTTNKNPSISMRWFNELNDIYLPQTNIDFIFRSANLIEIQNNLGSEVDIVDANSSSWEADVIAAKGDQSADINVYFVWKIANNVGQDKTDFLKGIAWGKNCFISDYQTRKEEIEIIIVAHEIGHSLGIPAERHFTHPKNKYKVMMYYISRFVGKEIPKVHVNILNP